MWEGVELVGGLSVIFNLLHFYNFLMLSFQLSATFLYQSRSGGVSNWNNVTNYVKLVIGSENLPEIKNPSVEILVVKDGFEQLKTTRYGSRQLKLTAVVVRTDVSIRIRTFLVLSDPGPGRFHSTPRVLRSKNSRLDISSASSIPPLYTKKSMSEWSFSGMMLGGADGEGKSMTGEGSRRFQ